LSLTVAWICVPLAAAAIIALTVGAVSLSERRGAFVSAVTHELRTPLTTFRMYAEMLAEGMVRDEATKQEYLKTLCTEADRLSHLVENVLAYARLERGRTPARSSPVSVGDLLARVSERLRSRADSAGMTLEVDGLEEGEERRVKADPSAVEQILFNLVDNACKYAGVAADRRLHIRVKPEKNRLAICVADHGPGISPEDRHRLFRPFGKSAREAADSAPGVGLGLALSRRLARAMGGELSYAPPGGDGAAFSLELQYA
jgi:signal transduction histidine kinase